MAKCNWTMSEASAWVKEHEGKSLEVEHEVSQEEIIDEIDYLKLLIDERGLSDKAKEAFKDLAKRLPGNDIPVEKKKDIETEGIKPVEEKKPDIPIPTNEEIQDVIGQVKF